MKRRHRGSKKTFWLLNKTIHVEIFWHHGYHKTGAEIYHVPSGQWDLVFGQRRSIFKKIRQMAIWLANPEVRKVSQRILGVKTNRTNEAKFWATEIDIETNKPRSPPKAEGMIT